MFLSMDSSTDDVFDRMRLLARLRGDSDALSGTNRYSVPDAATKLLKRDGNK
jgi:hypothetical protein